MYVHTISERGLERNLGREVYVEPLGSHIDGILIEENLVFYLLSLEGVFRIRGNEMIRIRCPSENSSRGYNIRRYKVKLSNRR